MRDSSCVGSLGDIEDVDDVVVESSVVVVRSMDGAGSTSGTACDTSLMHGKPECGPAIFLAEE